MLNHIYSDKDAVNEVYISVICESQNRHMLPSFKITLLNNFSVTGPGDLNNRLDNGQREARSDTLFPLVRQHSLSPVLAFVVIAQVGRVFGFGRLSLPQVRKRLPSS